MWLADDYLETSNSDFIRNKRNVFRGDIEKCRTGVLASIRTSDAALALVSFDKTTTRTLVSIRKNDAAFSRVKIQIKCAKNSVVETKFIRI